MGTDIHTIFQAKQNNEWYDIPHNYNEQRHYSLFAWLADVRQGNSYIKPISEPRGLPADFQINEDNDHNTALENIEPDLREYYTDKYPYGGSKNMGYHSFSWLLGSEILAAQPQPVAKQGIISVNYYRTWDKVSPPESYAADVSGGSTHVVTPDVVGYYKSATHVRVCWIAHLDRKFKYFTDEIRRLMEIHGEIRIVFGFDS